MRSRRTTMVVLVAGIWFVLGLFFFTQMYLLHPRTSRGYDSTVELSWELVLSALWACSTPLVLWISNRFRIERHHWGRPLAVHLVAGVVLGLVLCGLHGLILHALFNGGAPVTLATLLPSFYYNIDKMLMLYCVIVFINHSFVYYQRFRERDVLAAQLESRLAQAQLQALKMQLHPHFLFNTLNAISSLMHSDVEAADQMIARLSDLLRLTLESSGRQMVTLKEEIDFLNRYLGIEQIRFQDRLTVDISVAPETLDAQVPTLILQPLVENAIKHGIAPYAGAGHVEVSARREDGMLQLRVADNGSGFLKGATMPLKEGLGISNTKARLEKLYGLSHSFTITSGASRGVVVTISVPFRVFHEASSAALHHE